MLAGEQVFKQRSLWEIYYTLITTSDLPMFLANNSLIYLVEFLFAHFLVMYVLYLRTSCLPCSKVGRKKPYLKYVCYLPSHDTPLLLLVGKFISRRPHASIFF